MIYPFLQCRERAVDVVLSVEVMEANADAVAQSERTYVCVFERREHGGGIRDRGRDDVARSAAVERRNAEPKSAGPEARRQREAVPFNAFSR